jgi:hypothetical protein
LLAAPQARIETHGSMAMKWVWVMLLAGLSGCGGVPRGLQPVQNFDLRRFEGHWYEIARLDHRYERGLTRVSIDYRALPDDRVEIDSRGYDTIRREWRSQNGIARFQGSRNEASLEVSFLDAFHSRLQPPLFLAALAHPATRQLGHRIAARACAGLGLRYCGVALHSAGG